MTGSNRVLNTKALYIVLVIAAIIVAGQSSDAVLSSFAIRSAITAVMFVFVVFVPVTSMAIVVLGYFVPIITSAKMTLLPANFYYYLAMLVFALVCTLFSGKVETTTAGGGRKAKVLVFYILFILVVIISELAAYAFGGGSALTVNNAISLMLGLFGVLLVKDSRDEDVVLMTFVVTSVVLSCWTLFLAGKVNVVGDRYEVGFDQNYLSLFVGLGIVVLTSFLLCHRASLTRPLQLAFIGIYFLNWMAILRLGSRGIVIALALATVWMVLRNSKNISQTLVSIMLAAMLVVIITQLPGMEMMKDRFKDKDIATASRRMPLWIKSLQHIVSSSPWEIVFGGGGGAGKIALKQAFRANVPLSPHNQYLETAMDYGLLGLLSLLGLIYSGFRQSLKVPGYVGDMRAALVLFMLVGFMSLTPLMYVLPWVVFGFALAAPAIRENYA